MKVKGLIITSLAILFFFFTYFKTVGAFSGMLKSFGGKIIQTPAIEIRTVEATGFKCAVLGKTVSITPYGLYPRSYLIPAGVTNKTRKTVTSGKLLLGLYSPTPVPITCTNPSGATTVVTIPASITYFGTN